MMDWSNQNMTGWGYVLMSLGIVVFVGLAITAVVVLLRRRPDDGPGMTRPSQTPLQLLDERFARGDIDEKGLLDRRRALLATTPS